MKTTLDQTRCVSPPHEGGELSNVINEYNSTTAGILSPAGQSLVNVGLFTSTQLQQLEAVAPTIAFEPAGHFGLNNLLPRISG
jgi:hypothetical protein